MAATAGEKKLHIAMFPWLAFGHIIPFLELSKFIAQKGHRISFLSTKRNIDRLPKLPPNLQHLITFIKLTLPEVKELPEDAEATMDVRTEDIHYLKKAFDGLEPELTRFLRDQSPDWIIYDFAPHWLPSIAGELGISRAFFSIVNAWFVAFLGPFKDYNDVQKTAEDFMVTPKWVPFPTAVRYRRHEINWILGSAVAENASAVSDFHRAASVILGSDVIFIRHCYEFEPQWLTLLEELHRKPVIPVGLMPPSAEDIAGDDDNETWVSIKNWLQTQKRGSVVYVALGSEVSLSQSQLTELALGLEKSGLSFFWVLRNLPGSSTRSDLVNVLPVGFLERTENRGRVWTSWVPQLKILSHDSVGRFLTHCGWSSIVEGLMFGHPLIMLPFLVDQGLNARVFEEKRVGIEVPRDELDGSFTRDSVADSLSRAIVGEEGKEYKENAMKISAIFGDRDLHKGYVENFIEYLENKMGNDASLNVSTQLSFYPK